MLIAVVITSPAIVNDTKGPSSNGWNVVTMDSIHQMRVQVELFRIVNLGVASALWTSKASSISTSHDEELLKNLPDWCEWSASPMTDLELEGAHKI